VQRPVAQIPLAEDSMTQNLTTNFRLLGWHAERAMLMRIIDYTKQLGRGSVGLLTGAAYLFLILWISLDLNGAMILILGAVEWGARRVAVFGAAYDFEGRVWILS
jgi:hypothetical protein